MSAVQEDTRARFRNALPVVTLALAAPFLTWWAVGDLSTSNAADPDHAWGPYHLDPHLELLVGALAAALGLASVIALGVQVRRDRPCRRTWIGGGCLCLAGVIAGAAWRVATAGVDGSNIGGGVVALAAPLLIAGLLVSATVITTPQTDRPRHAGRTTGIVVTALSAPALLGLLLVLKHHDRNVGVISQDRYTGVHLGDSRTALHHALGDPGGNEYQFFAPVQAGLSCEYYVASNAGTDPASMTFRFCFRANVLVSKEMSNQIYGN